MKDVIEQISKIDEIAFENEQMNTALLAEEEGKYQSTMQNYRQEQITQANRLAESTYIKIIQAAQAEVSEKASESAKKIEKFKIQFSLSEKDVISKILEKLFLIEKEG